MPRVPPRLSLLALAYACSFEASADAEAPAIVSKALAPIAASKAVVADWRTQLCALPELGCAANPTTLTLYRAGGDPPSAAWGILEAGPVLVKLRGSSTTAWAIERRWDFSAYKHSGSGLVTDSPEPIFVYPALYPVGPGTWAVAVVARASQTFSGGGAGYQSADFVVLGEGDPTAAAYSNVPFSCSKDLRGCFTEEEYRRSPNCRDLYEGFLTIAHRPSKSSERYAWTLTWHERHQPAGAQKSQTQVTRTTVDVPVDKAVDASSVLRSFSFCGGGLMGDPGDPSAPAP